MSPLESKPLVRAVVDPRAFEGVDRVALVLVVGFLVVALVRGVIPALLHGEDWGTALFTVSTGLVALAAVLLPPWQQRRRIATSGLVAGARTSR